VLDAKLHNVVAPPPYRPGTHHCAEVEIIPMALILTYWAALSRGKKFFTARGTVPKQPHLHPDPGEPRNQVAQP
jgi:hypothetical protein